MAECKGVTKKGFKCQRSGYLRSCCEKCHLHCLCISKRIYKKDRFSKFNPGELYSDSEQEDELIPDEDDIDFIASEGDPEEEKWTDDES